MRNCHNIFTFKNKSPAYNSGMKRAQPDSKKNNLGLAFDLVPLAQQGDKAALEQTAHYLNSYFQAVSKRIFLKYNDARVRRTTDATDIANTALFNTMHNIKNIDVSLGIVSFISYLNANIRNAYHTARVEVYAIKRGGEQESIPEIYLEQLSATKDMDDALLETYVKIAKKGLSPKIFAAWKANLDNPEKSNIELARDLGIRPETFSMRLTSARRTFAQSKNYWKKILGLDPDGPGDTGFSRS
jgi:hypothetical protein